MNYGLQEKHRRIERANRVERYFSALERADLKPAITGWEDCNNSKESRCLQLGGSVEDLRGIQDETESISCAALDEALERMSPADISISSRSKRVSMRLVDAS